MRRRLRLACIFCIVGLMLCCGCMDAQESDALVFHVDPSTVRERFEVGLLFEHLSAVLDALGAEDFVATRDGLREMNVDRAHLPSSLIDVCNRYVELCEVLSETTESLSVAIDECDRSLQANDLTRAGLSLGISRSLLVRAREQMASLERATDEAFAILRRSGQGGSSSQLEQSRQTIDSAIERISRLAFEYESRLEEARLRAAVKSELWQPDLTISVRDEAVWVGDETVLSGVLTVDGNSVAGRQIVLLLDGAVAGYAKTDSTGAFTQVVILPFDYVPSHVVRASFQPTGDDLGSYGAALSDDCVVTVRYHTSTVTVDVPPQMYPGLGATVEGMVACSGVIEGREVQVLVGNDVVGTRRTGPEGDFRIDFALAEDAVEGEVPVRAVVAADASEKAAPCDSTVGTKITRVEPSVEASLSRFVFVPSVSSSMMRQVASGEFVGMETVSVDVFSRLPLGPVEMSVASGERYVSWTQDGLHSEVQVPVVCRVWETGMRSLIVSASVDEPWHQASSVTARFMVVNMLIPIVVLLFLGMALGLGVIISRRLRTAVAEPGPILSPTFDVTADDTPPDAADHISFESIAGPREMLARLYFQAVAMLQRSLGVRLRREMTLREYLASVRQRLGSEARIFGRLTNLTEEGLYGPREIDSQGMRLGRRLLGMLRSAHANIEKDDTGDTQ